MRIRSKNRWNIQFYLFELRVNTMLIRPGLCWSIEEVTSNIAPTFRDTHCGLACDVCDRLLGTRYYFSPGGGGLGGISWFLEEQNGGSVESHGNQTRLCWIKWRSYFEHCACFRVRCLWPPFIGTRHCLSPGGGGRGILGGVTWLLGEQNNNNNNNNNNGLLTVYPPSGSSPVKNYNIYKKRKTIIYHKNKIELKSAV